MLFATPYRPIIVTAHCYLQFSVHQRAVFATMAAPPEMQLPLAFSTWLGQNGASLTPPVSNCCLYSGKDFVLMVVGGPNTRNDFHGPFYFAELHVKTILTTRIVNQTEEWFYQLKGTMKLRLVENNMIRDIHLKEGEMFLVPGRP